MRHNKMSKAAKSVAVAIGLVLAAAPLSACGGTGTGGGSANPYDGTREVTGNPDPATWKTIGDAMDGSPVTLSSAYDNEHYIAVYECDGRVSRIVATMTPKAAEALGGIDYADGQETADKTIREALQDIPIDLAEDITAGRLDDVALAGYVGRTGQDLVNDGFEFDYYSVTGESGAGATFTRGYFSYLFMFDAEIGAETPEDGGASILAAPVTQGTYVGISGAATNLDLVGGSVDDGQAAKAATVAPADISAVNVITGGSAAAS